MYVHVVSTWMGQGGQGGQGGQNMGRTWTWAMVVTVTCTQQRRDTCSGPAGHRGKQAALRRKRRKGDVIWRLVARQAQPHGRWVGRGDTSMQLSPKSHACAPLGHTRAFHASPVLCLRYAALGLNCRSQICASYPQSRRRSTRQGVHQAVQVSVQPVMTVVQLRL